MMHGIIKFQIVRSFELRPPVRSKTNNFVLFLKKKHQKLSFGKVEMPVESMVIS
jgi:hypothetical protein